MSTNNLTSDITLYDCYGNDYIFKYTLDTNAEMTFITEKVFNSLKLKSESSITINNLDNTQSVIKLSNFNLSILNHEYINLNVGVLPDNNEIDIIIGNDIVSKL